MEFILGILAIIGGIFVLSLVYTGVILVYEWIIGDSVGDIDPFNVQDTDSDAVKIMKIENNIRLHSSLYNEMKNSNNNANKTK